MEMISGFFARLATYPAYSPLGKLALSIECYRLGVRVSNG